MVSSGKNEEVLSWRTNLHSLLHFIPCTDHSVPPGGGTSAAILAPGLDVGIGGDRFSWSLVGDWSQKDAFVWGLSRPV